MVVWRRMATHANAGLIDAMEAVLPRDTSLALAAATTNAASQMTTNLFMASIPAAALADLSVSGPEREQLCLMLQAHGVQRLPPLQALALCQRRSFDS